MQVFRASLSAVLSICLIGASVPGWGEAAHAAKDEASAGGSSVPEQAEGDAKILHALNRFSFGPRPGDVAALRAEGLDRWFEQQLHPSSLDNSTLEARLGRFPAMRWSPADLLFRLPSNAIIRQAIDGKIAVPNRGALHVVYENQMARVSAKRQEQQKKQTTAAAGPGAGTVAAGPMSGEAQPSSMQSEIASAAPAVDPGLALNLAALPPSERVMRLASMPQPQLDAFLKSLKGPLRVALTAEMPPDLRETAEALENPERVVTEELMAQRLTRDIYSNAQLQEVMTDFWLNHFNVFLRKNEATPYYLVSFERDVIRPRALGKFEDLLEAVAHSPAMMLYLDNAESIGPDSRAAMKAQMRAVRNPDKGKKTHEGLNENYARELMELHTLGVNGGYSQTDVIQAARILTGWTVEQPQRGGGFEFDENRHEPGTKKVLGKKFKEHGEREGRDLLHLLATRPATAKFISRKLAIRFISDDPPQAVVDRMAKTFLSSDGDLAAVLRTMYRSPEFWSKDVVSAKVKTPLEFVVSAVRAGNADVSNMQPLVNALREMGMPLYGCIPPTGYKWDAADWVSTGALVNRMNFALSLAANRFNGIDAVWATEESASIAPGASAEQVQPEQAGTAPSVEEARLERLIVPGGVSGTTRAAVLQQFQQQSTQLGISAKPVAMRPNAAPRGNSASSLEKQDQLLAGLLLGSPEFQRR